ncbi:MAG: pyridoxal-phosphate dependent enzyme [Planctomycetes bacterium]|nr:pyridoxal-phosphate dependent enzyme [Planctomycetota bacterium]
MSPAEVARAVAVAAERLPGEVVRTPTVASAWWSAACGREVRLKLENVQATGSFKLRGATHALQRLPAAKRARGVVAASSGNHGLGLASAARTLGVAATVYVPTTTAAEKRAAIAALGATVVVHGDDCVDTETRARADALTSGRAYISPYNDPDVLAGQGTIAVELLAQWPEVETVYVAMGGGGLLAGMAAYAKSVRPDVEFVACSPAASPAMAACVRAGAIVDVPCHDTFSDSTAGGVEPGAITFPLCRDLVDRWIEVDERAIAEAVADTLAHAHLLVEGAAGVAFAACRQDVAARGRRAAVIVCGGNVPYQRLRAMLALAGR